MKAARNKPLSSIGALSLVAAAIAIGLTPPAGAQQPGSTAAPELQPPVPVPPSKTPSVLIGTVEAMLLAGLIIGVNFIPSKRGHQD